MKVAWHLGLGDAIICAPLIVKLANEQDIVEVPCWERNHISVSSLFKNIDNIEVFTVDIDQGFDEFEYKLGTYNNYFPQNESEDFAEWFYRQKDFDINKRLDYCPIFHAAESVEQRVNPYTVHDYIFLHHDIDRGYDIDISKINSDRLPIKMWAEDYHSGILSHANIILNAKEIHCIDSSFIHLVEALNAPGKKFYHKYARPESTDFKYLKGWEVIE